MSQTNDQTVEIKDEDIQEEEFTSEVIESDQTDWKAEALKLKGIATRRATQLKKAKEVLAKASEFKPEAKPQDKKDSKESNDLDYGQKAYLVANGIKESTEVDLVKNIMANTGKSLEQVLESKYFQAELKELKESIATKNAIPQTSVRSTTSTKDSVDFWIAKGELPPADQVQLRREVVRARVARETRENPFTANPVVQ